MTNFFKITNSDGKQIVVITDRDFRQVQEYYASKHLSVTVESVVPSKKEVIQAVPLA